MNFLPGNLPYRFIAFSLLLATAIFVLDNINHRFWLNDFKVYYFAAEALVNGKPVYGTLFSLGSGYYKYSPLALLFFIPYTLLPYYVACAIHFFIVSGCFVLSVLVIRRIVTTYLLPDEIKYADLLLCLVNICVLLHLVREQELGNVNVILILLLSAVLLLVLQNRQGAAGIIMGLSIMLKPYLLILLLPLLLHRKFKSIFLTLITVAASIVAPTLLLGVSQNITLHKQWLVAMKSHSDHFLSNHTVQSLISNNFYPGLPAVSNFIIMGIVIVAYLFLFWFSRNRMEETRQLIFQYFLLLAVIPNVLITDTEQFLYSLPLIIIIISHAWVMKKRNYLIIALLVVTILLYGGNSSDLLGNNLSGIMESTGMLGLSNLFIISLGLYFFFSGSYEQVRAKPLPLKE